MLIDVLERSFGVYQDIGMGSDNVMSMPDER